ncbi:MAG TPA: thioredoxin domain-containing protein [Thermodesulfobacteriota bacterium]|nr:thioredoxin domain-containing protein [Thermodesulfobacteriota bacterium]
MVKNLLRGLTIAFMAALTLSPFLPAQTVPSPVEGFCLSGNPGAPVRLEIYSDYQCPSCREFYLATIVPLLRDYSRQNKICFLYHDFPLKIHKYAIGASRISVAARKMGREQWLRVSEALYADQAKWSIDGKPEMAAARVLSSEEMTRLKKILEDPSVDTLLNKEIEEAQKRQVNSTPTFFLWVEGREQKIVGGVSYAVLKNHLDRILK